MAVGLRKMEVSGSTGNITTNGTITAGGNITGSVGSFNYIVCRGTTGRPIIPTAIGALLGVDGNRGYCALELCANTGCYVDFATPNFDFSGRVMFMHASASFYWHIGASIRLTLSATSLTGPAHSATSDKRLKFNE